MRGFRPAQGRRRVQSSHRGGELAAADRKLVEFERRLSVAVLARGGTLIDLFGIGRAGAAPLLV